mgnify:CR=1 FL=1
MNNKSIHIETTKRTVVLIAIIAMTFYGYVRFKYC